MNFERSLMLLSFAKSYAYQHQIPILLITHDPLIAKYLGNRLWILQNGHIGGEFGLEKMTMNPEGFFSGHRLYKAVSLLK